MLNVMFSVVASLYLECFIFTYISIDVKVVIKSSIWNCIVHNYKSQVRKPLLYHIRSQIDDNGDDDDDDDDDNGDDDDDDDDDGDPTPTPPPPTPPHTHSSEIEGASLPLPYVIVRLEPKFSPTT